MKPYIGESHKGSQKYVPDSVNDIFGSNAGFMRTISKTEKLVTKNANRSRKKAARQDSKRELRNVT